MLATNLALIGALLLSFLSCLAYGKQGITAVTCKQNQIKTLTWKSKIVYALQKVKIVQSGKDLSHVSTFRIVQHCVEKPQELEKPRYS
jgi:pyruvate/2-oxoglutarate/acetoin dehydrogenase E1 component